MRKTSSFAAKMVMVFASIASFGGTSVVSAHHSFAVYDNSKEVVLVGVVRSFRWANPHGQIVLMVKEGDRQVEYDIEMSGVNVMTRNGWKRNSVKPGDRLTVTIHPMRDGSNAGSFAGAVKADGTVLRSPAPR